MAKVSIATGNWSTAGTWGTVTNTPDIHATTNLTLTTGNTFTATFTAPNTTDQCLGVLLYLVAQGTTTINVTLQESTVDTAATVAVAFTNAAVTTAQGWYFFRFATPYTFTTTGAGAYRFRITLTSNTTAATCAANAGGTTPAYLAVDGRTGAPGAEAAWITGSNNATAVTVTMEGTRTVGAGTDTSTLGTTSQRSVGIAVQISDQGILTHDITANSTLTSLGHIVVSASGIHRVGTAASPVPSTYTARITLNQNGTGGNYGYSCAFTGTSHLQGATRSFIQTTYVSGVGTAANPVIMADAVGWLVGDRVVIAGDVYNQFEVRYIITVNSPTSYVWSSTPGGSENALTNTHTSGNPIANTTNSVVIDTNSTSQGFYTFNGSGVAGRLDWDWATFENTGVAAQGGKQGVFLGSLNASGASAGMGNVDNCVVYNPIFCGFASINHSTTTTHTNLVVCNGTTTAAPTTGAAIALLANTANKTLVTPLIIGMGIGGIFITTTSNTTITSPKIWNVNSGNVATTGAFLFSSPTIVTVNSGSIQANRSQGMVFSTATKVTFNTLACGNLATNTVDIVCSSGSVNVDVHFETPTFGSATLISSASYTGQGAGSKISMQNVNSNTSDHRTYEPGGTTRTTGTGLADTNVRTSGSLAWRLAPENNTTGLVKEFLILARANSAVSVLGFIQKNAAFGSSVCRVELYLPDAPTVVAATQTMPNDTNFNVFSLAANYTGSEDRYAVVRITAISSTASAYVYVDDIFNGTNEITAFDTFYRGEPGPIMFDQLGDPNAVWQVLTNTLTTSGTTGYLLTKLLKLATYIGLK